MNWKNISLIENPAPGNLLFRIENKDGSIFYSTGYIEQINGMTQIWRDPYYHIGPLEWFKSIYYINIEEIQF